MPTVAMPAEPRSCREVEIYTRRRCPRCTFAKQLLERKGVAYVEHAVEAGPEVAVLMRVRTGANTLPQILLRGRALGGCHDLHRLDREGLLDRMLVGGRTGDP
jgi:glutaredoxin 3